MGRNYPTHHPSASSAPGLFGAKREEHGHLVVKAPCSYFSLSLGAGDLAFSATGTYASLVGLMGIAWLCEVEHIT